MAENGQLLKNIDYEAQSFKAAEMQSPETRIKLWQAARTLQLDGI